MHPRLRKLGRIAAWVVGALVALVVVLVVGGYAALHTDWGREKVRTQALKALAPLFVGKLDIGRVEGDLFGDVVLRDLSLTDATGQKVVAARAARITFSIWPLVHQHVFLHKLRIEGLRVDGVQKADGTINLAGLMKPQPEKKEPSKWTVDIDKVELVDGALALTRPAPAESVHLDDFEIHAGLHLGSNGAVRTRADVTGSWRERAAPLAVSAGFRSGGKGTPLEVPGLHASLGGVVVAARAVKIETETKRVDAELTVIAPAGEVARLAPGTKLTQDLSANVSVHPAGDGVLHAVLTGVLGVSPLSADLSLEPEKKHLTGLVQTHRLDLRAFAPQALATLVNATFAVDARQDEAGALQIARAHIYVDAHAGNAETRADAHVDLVASGTVSQVADATSLAVRGTVVARDLVHADKKAKVVSLDIDATGLPSRPAGRVHLEAGGIVDAGRAVGLFVADARSQPDRSIVFHARSVPPSGPWLIDIDAVARVAPDLVQIALGKHVFKTQGLAWKGSGGTIEVRPDRVVVAGLRTGLADGRVAVDATYYRAGAKKGDLDATLAAERLDLKEVDRSFGISPKLGPDARIAGTIDLRAHVASTGGRLTAQVGGRAQGLSVRADVTPIDASLDAHVDASQVVLDATVRGVGVGAFTASFDVTPPARLTDANAWRQLDRSAIRRGRHALENLDLAAMQRLTGKPPTTTGRVDGELTFTAQETNGAIHVRGVETPALVTPVDADLGITQTGHGLVTATLAVTLREVTTVHAVAMLAVPAKPFDTAAWAALDADEMRGITVKVEDFVLDARKSRRLGLTQSWYGRATAMLQVDPGFTAVSAAIDANGLRGGPLARPADLHLEARLDGERLTVSGSGTIDGRPVIGLDGHAPVGLPAILRDGGVALAQAPLVGRLSIDQLPLSALGTAGNAETVDAKAPLSGTLNARAMILGTVARPVGRVNAVVSNVGGGDGGNVLRELRAEASYDGSLVHAAVNGRQSNGGKLVASVDFPVAAVHQVEAKLEAQKFDLAPLEHLAPMRLYGLAGVVDAKLAVTGAELARDTKIDGHLKIDGARIPLAATIGTLRRATLDVKADKGEVTVKVHGEVGDGKLDLQAHAQIEGLDPRSAEATLVVDQITLVNQLQPRIAAALDVKVHRDGEVWRVDARLHEGSLVVPEEKGNQLHPTGAPSDMVFIENGRPPPAVADPKGSSITIGQRPLHPYLVAKLTITPTRVKSKELNGLVRGELTAEVGTDSASVDGLIQVARGEVDLFDRRYRIERANLRFDGDVDPVLDIRLVHDFPEVTLYAQVRGRLSKPVLDLTSEPATYSQGQLLSYLLGGNPGADPGNEVQSAATGVASSLVSQKVGKYLGKVLPVELDVLRFEAATAGNSAAVTVGKWITRKLFVAYRRHLESRPDENAGEGQLEYYLGRRVLIEATVGDRGYHGADLLWLRRW
jgi:hypothetical protein